jgi:hypothetical protein
MDLNAFIAGVTVGATLTWVFCLAMAAGTMAAGTMAAGTVQGIDSDKAAMIYTCWCASRVVAALNCAMLAYRHESEFAIMLFIIFVVMETFDTWRSIKRWRR